MSRVGKRFKDEEPLDQDAYLYQPSYRPTSAYTSGDMDDGEDDGFDTMPADGVYGTYDLYNAYDGDGYDDGYDDYDYEYEEPRRIGVFSFIARHWIPYLIAAVIAISLGAIGAAVIYRIGSTPDKDTAEVTTNEENQAPADDEISSEAQAATGEAVNTVG